MPLPENTSLNQYTKPYLHKDLVLKSRIHELNTFGHNAFVKRDDELSAGITGSKYRKFASLIPFLKQNGSDEILLIGSAQSNNVAGILQLLNEEKINCKLMLLQSNENQLKGNLLWIRLLHNTGEIIWVTRQQWPGVNNLAEDYCKQQAGKNIFVITEGASVPQAMPGAISLAKDIVDYEFERNFHFQNIFIDSGSGTAAIGLLYGFALANISNKHIFITLIAGSEDDFFNQYKTLVARAASIYGWPEKYFGGEITFTRPAISPSFGSVTTQVLDEVRFLAMNEGILAEPVYTAKHFYTSRKILSNMTKGAGKSLVINSGGSFGLAGFQEKLAAQLPVVF